MYKTERQAKYNANKFTSGVCVVEIQNNRGAVIGYDWFPPGHPLPANSYKVAEWSVYKGKWLSLEADEDEWLAASY